MNALAVQNDCHDCCYSDRLSELEREKAVLAEQLKNQERESMFKEMEIMRQRYVC